MPVSYVDGLLRSPLPCAPRSAASTTTSTSEAATSAISPKRLRGMRLRRRKCGICALYVVPVFGAHAILRIDGRGKRSCDDLERTAELGSARANVPAALVHGARGIVAKDAARIELREQCAEFQPDRDGVFCALRCAQCRRVKRGRIDVLGQRAVRGTVCGALARDAAQKTHAGDDDDEDRQCDREVAERYACIRADVHVPRERVDQLIP